MTRRTFLAVASTCAVFATACKATQANNVPETESETDSSGSSLFTKSDSSDPREPWPLPDVDDYPSMVLTNANNMFSASYFHVPEDLVIDYVDEFKSFAAENDFDFSESSGETSYALSATWQVVDDEGHVDQRELRLTYQSNETLSLTIGRNVW